MQVRMKRGMGGPPAEKKMTGLPTPAVDRLVRENYRSGSLPSRNHSDDVGVLAKKGCQPPSLGRGWGVSRMEIGEGSWGARFAWVTASGLLSGGLLDPVRARFRGVTSWTVLAIGCRRGIPRPSNAE